MQKICHVCSAHNLDDARVFHKECRTLAEAGYEVHLIASAGKLARPPENGIIFHPLKTCQSRLERMGRRNKVADMAAQIKADLYHVHEPELLGPMLRKANGTPVVFDIHESYLDVLSHRSWIPNLVRPVVKWLWDRSEKRLIKHCRALVTATDHIAGRYRPMHSNVIVVRNFPDFSQKLFDENVSKREGTTCVFAGGLTPDRNIENTVLALGILKRRGVVSNLVLAGDWSSQEFERTVSIVAEEQGVAEQVLYMGKLSREDALKLQASASIGLVNILPIPNSIHSLPVKMFECMALGLPLIYSNFPTFRQYVGQCGAGIEVDPAQPEHIANALQQLIQDPGLARQLGEAGKRAVQKQFNWKNERVKLLELYSEILCHPN